MLNITCRHWTASPAGPAPSCSKPATVRVSSTLFGVREYLCAEHAQAVFSGYPHEADLQRVPTADLDPFVEQLLQTAVVELRVVKGALGTLSEGRAWFAVANPRTGEILTERVEAEEILAPSIFGPTDWSLRPARDDLRLSRYLA